jgi:hypothetical protein
LTRFISLPEFFWLAEQVTGIDAEVLANSGSINLADSALHAPQASFGDQLPYPTHQFHVATAVATRIRFRNDVVIVAEARCGPWRECTTSNGGTAQEDLRRADIERMFVEMETWPSVTVAISNRDQRSPECLLADRSNSTDPHLGLWTSVIPTMGNNYSWL